MDSHADRIRESMSAGDAQAALRDIGVIRGATDQLESAVARRNGRSSRRSVERTERRATTLGHTPRLDAALAKGKIGAEHADPR